MHVSVDPVLLIALNALIAAMTFAMALGLRPQDFQRVMDAPRAPLTGLCAQFVLLPASTCLAVWWLPIAPDLGLAMLLVACCPGGNFSNLLVWLGRANVALSVSLTAVSSVLAVALTPLNFAFYASLNPRTRELVTAVSVDPLPLLAVLIFVLALPLAAGMVLGLRAPALALRLQVPLRRAALALLLLFVAGAFAAHWDVVQRHGARIVALATAHNIGALLVGALAAALARLPTQDARAVTVEVGVQNTGLGLLLLLTFFPEFAAMAVFAAFWGVPHLVTGLGLAAWWARHPPASVKA